MEASPQELLSQYSEIRECDFKERHYSVRDNGAIYRHPKKDCRPSKLDCIWTFGSKDNKTGYMLYGGVVIGNEKYIIFGKMEYIRISNNDASFSVTMVHRFR